MDVVVRDPHLLERIFSTGFDEYDKRYFSSFALVCKTWCEPALDVLWRDIRAPKMPCLFRILSRLKKTKRQPNTSKRSLTLVQEPTLEGWQRFQYYARRVRVLTYAYTTSDHGPRMDPTAYDSLALVSAGLPIFPNLHTFSVDSSLLRASIFLHSGIQQLWITLPSDRNRNRDSNLEDDFEFLHNVRLRVVNLTSLSISVELMWSSINFGPEFWSIYPLEGEIEQILFPQTGLCELSLPMFWMTTKVVNAISRLERLKSISVPPRSFYGHPLESVSFYPLCGQDYLKPPLPSLQYLTLSVPYTAFHSFLDRWVSPHTHFTTQLQALTLRSQILESSTALQAVLHSISTCCPGMKKLSISSVRRSRIFSSDPLHYGFDGGSASVATPPPERWSLKTLLPFRVNLATVASLFQLTQLKHLDLHHNLPAAFSSSDLEIIATNFRHLTRLDLFSDPCTIVRSMNLEVRFDEVILNPEDYADRYVFDLRTPLRVLGSLCPELRSLGIFLCADPTITEQKSSSMFPTPLSTAAGQSSSASQSPFPKLRTLNFGGSPILGQEMSVAGILCEYVGEDIDVTTRGLGNLSKGMRGGEPYTERLSDGGVVPEPIPDFTGTAGDEKAKLWSLDTNGEPLGDDFAVVVTEKGEPLSLSLEWMPSDESGVKRLPGVLGPGKPGCKRPKPPSPYPDWREKWSKLNSALPLVLMIFKQEKERAEKMNF